MGCTCAAVASEGGALMRQREAGHVIVLLRKRQAPQRLQPRLQAHTQYIVSCKYQTFILDTITYGALPKPSSGPNHNAAQE